MSLRNYQIFTIGAYGHSEESYFSALKNNNIDTFIDIRQRRGLRGSKFSWANSTRLQNKLAEIGVRYIHLKNLAPTTEIREQQKIEDQRWGIAKRDRTQLGQVFIKLYRESCLIDKHVMELFESIPNDAKNVVFFCVEKLPKACHRSIVAEHLSANFSIQSRGEIHNGGSDCLKDKNKQGQ